MYRGSGSWQIRLKIAIESQFSIIWIDSIKFSSAVLRGLRNLKYRKDRYAHITSAPKQRPEVYFWQCKKGWWSLVFAYGSEFYRWTLYDPHLIASTFAVMLTREPRARWDSSWWSSSDPVLRVFSANFPKGSSRSLRRYGCLCKYVRHCSSSPNLYFPVKWCPTWGSISFLKIRKHFGKLFGALLEGKIDCGFIPFRSLLTGGFVIFSWWIWYASSMRSSLQCLHAIEELHSIGFISRDVKPDNFAVGIPGKLQRLVRMIDFGICSRWIPFRVFLSTAPRGFWPSSYSESGVVLAAVYEKKWTFFNYALEHMSRFCRGAVSSSPSEMQRSDKKSKLFRQKVRKQNVCCTHKGSRQHRGFAFVLHKSGCGQLYG